MKDGQLLNIATVWHIEEALQGSGGGFRDHPLRLPLHEFGAAVLDFSTLSVALPLTLPRRGRLTEPEEMLQPLARLCDQLGDRFQADEFVYAWYYLELLDRDERVQPLCWISPALLYREFPDERERPILRLAGLEGLGENPYPRRLLTMDDLWRRPTGDERERHLWQDWLAETWQENEASWLAEGLLSYEAPRPWMCRLGFSAELQRDAEAEGDEWETDARAYPPLHLARASAGAGGLYWMMIPLYDQRDLGSIWSAMKQDLYVTSVFSMAAGAQQDRQLWRRLEERFQLRQRRMSRYQYLVRYREQKVLDWTREGKSASEIARLLVDQRLHPFDPAGPLLSPSLPAGARDANLASARQVVVRIRMRLQKEGVLEKLPSGRRKEAPQTPTGEGKPPDAGR